MDRPNYPLRPFLPPDTMALRELFAQSIDVLTEEDYDEEQRVAWASEAEDAEAFAKRLSGMVTLVVEVDGELVGFGSLKDNMVVDMLFVHPYAAGEGVGSTILDALERLAKARGSETLTVQAGDTATLFFEARGYKGTERSAVLRDDLWLTMTTLVKQLKAAGKPDASPSEAV
jgi:putative acetyltransferase